MLGKITRKIKNDGFLSAFKWGISSVKIRAEQRKSQKVFDYDAMREDDPFALKKTRRAFILATVPFYDIGGGQRSAQLASAFNASGFSVFYLYAFKSSDIRSAGVEIPAVMHRFIDSVNADIISGYMREGDLLIAEAPCGKFLPYLEAAKNKRCKIVYESIDNWETSLGNGIYSEETLARFLESADLLTATARPLVEQLSRKLAPAGTDKSVLYSPNAVNDELFNPMRALERPSDLAKGEKVFVYYGSLWGDWFDWDTVFYLAKQRPGYGFCLIGDTSSVRERVSSAPANVTFPGVKRQKDLPAYLSHADGALLPFKLNSISEYVSPLKVFEYIAMNKPVLSGKLPDIGGYPLVYEYSSPEEALDMIDRMEQYLAASSRFTAQNNWFSRIDAMTDILYPKRPAPSISVVVLNHNNDKVIFRCVESLILNNSYGYQITVVDNCSTDGSYEKLVESYSERINIVRNSKNGCSSGRNLGVSASRGDLIVFLDSDQWVRSEKWLDVYLKISKTENFGCVAWGGGWFNDAGYNYRVADNYPYKYLEPPYLAKRDIGCLATCGFLIPRKIFDEVGGFDEAYDPTCYEDSDLSLAVRNKGYEIYYSSCLGVGHLPHQTTKEGSDAHAKLIKEKGDYFVSKWKKINPELLDYKKY
ncbi:MAG: glycosyltransferase [Clostridia bacterium]|nr:glycosyltransferase [Clostridia bacterium]